MKLKVKKRGNSLSVILPKEIASNLHVGDGDTLFITKTQLGYQVSAYDPEFEQKMNAARQGMRKYRNALIKLAE